MNTFTHFKKFFTTSIAFYFFNFAPPWRIFYLLGSRIHLTNEKWIQFDNTVLDVFSDEKEVIFNGEKTFTGTGIRTHDLSTQVFFISITFLTRWSMFFVGVVGVVGVVGISDGVGVELYGLVSRKFAATFRILKLDAWGSML